LTGICITAIGAIPFATATNIATLVSGRVVCGIGVGVLSSTVGLWQAETAPANSRGRYLVAQLLCGANLGLFLAQWINYGFYAQTGRAAFVFPVAFQLVWLLIAGTLVLGLPESPRWLAKYDRTDEALEILTRLLGPEQAQQAMQQILESNELENRVSGGQISALLRNGPTQNFRRVCLACGVMIMHQLNGVNSKLPKSPKLSRSDKQVDRHRRYLLSTDFTSDVPRHWT
jgi:MFS family permease